MSNREVEVYHVGLVCLSACAPKDMPIEEVESLINVQHPTGIASAWRKSKDPTFKAGEPNPCPCNDHPDGRVHYLLEC